MEQLLKAANDLGENIAKKEMQLKLKEAIKKRWTPGAVGWKEQSCSLI